MIESISSDNIFEYKKLSLEELKSRGILGRLVGVIADSVKPTRNGRKYSAELWEKVFQDPIMKEKIENRVCFGEACHPVDGREEVDPEKVAICLAEVPKKNKKGLLVGVFDILDTPCGRILKTMADYGANIGVSSRGSGDVIQEFDGTEAVDSDTYNCICWDAVFVPAVKEARLKYVTESLDNNTMNQALLECLNSASDEDRKLMKETLDNLNIDIENNSSYQQNAVNNIPERDNLAVDDNEAILNQLQEALKQVKQLNDSVIELQEKLSVSYTKEAKQEQAITKYKKAILKLSESAKQVDALQELNEKLQNTLDSKVSELTSLRSKLSESMLNVKAQSSKVAKLSESINSYHEDNVKMVELNKQLSEEYEKKEQLLNEQLEEVKKDFELNKQQYAAKLGKSNKLVEKYKSVAEHAVSKYIKSRAIQLGVDENEIRNRLSESYTFDDIDKVCEQVQSYNLSMSKLPFNTGLTENMRLKIKSPKQEHINSPMCSEDDVDTSLLSLAGLK